MLEVIALNKTIHRLEIFKDYNALIEHQRCCIFGENGLGKTTLLCIIAGLESYQSGEFTLSSMPLDKPLECIAIASDAITYPPFLSAQEVILLNQRQFTCKAADALIKGFSLNEHLHKPISALSSGNIKKVQLCCALMRKAKLYLLDEPSAYLDTQSIKFLFEALENAVGQVIVTSNEPELFAKHGFVTQHLHGLAKSK
ncbi:ATP-binding cassette domain-containing protein [Ningiella sp. W23]|uniref:ATP-binding cassette domain-containing protein n=1 Tax=Ningiella sp. W23 TaxID=3023715 RepID=UPI00375692E3